MDLKIKKDDYNPLLKRKEVYAEVAHEKEGSPSRVALREAVASKYGTKLENVYVIDIHTRTGEQQSLCQIQVYDEGFARKLVPQHLQIRNLPSEERKKAREQKTKKREEKAKPEAKAPLKKEEKTKEGKKEEEVKAQPKEGKEPAKESKEAKEPPKQGKEPAKEGKAGKQQAKETSPK